MRETKLKPCPFCGGEVRLHIAELDAFRDVYSFLCEDCEFEMVYPYSDKEKAIKAYNTRKPIEEIVERLEEKHSKSAKCPKFEKAFRQVAFEEAIEIVKEVGA